jgi:hypothetical protein
MAPGRYGRPRLGERRIWRIDRFRLAYRHLFLPDPDPFA